MKYCNAHGCLIDHKLTEARYRIYAGNTWFRVCEPCMQNSVEFYKKYKVTYILRVI